MPIKYDIIMDDNIVYPISYVCFGSLNSLRNRNRPYGCGPLDHLPSEYQSGNLFNVSKIEYVRYNFEYTLEEVGENIDRFKSELKLLMSSLPCIRDIVFVKNKYFYVRVKNQPADKVMFALMMVRNLARDCCYDFGEMNSGYAILRQYGLDPIRAIVANNLASVYSESDWETDEQNCFIGTYPVMGGESAIFSFRSFGAESLRRFLAQDDYNPWYQSSFAEQETGYFRGSHFASRNISYEGLDRNLVNTSERHVRMYNSSPNSYWYTYVNSGLTQAITSQSHRVLEDCHSIVGDETPLIPGTKWCGSGGFYTERDGFFPDVEDKVEALVELFNSF